MYVICLISESYDELKGTLTEYGKYEIDSKENRNKIKLSINVLKKRS